MKVGCSRSERREPFWHVARIRTQVAPLVGSNRRQQFLPRLDVQRPTDVHLAHLRHERLSGIAFANMKSGHVKPGPLSLRSFQAHSPSAPIRQAVGAHQLAWPGRRFIFQHFIMSCH